MSGIGSIWIGQDVEVFFFGYNPYTNILLDIANPYLFDYNADSYRALLRPCYTTKAQVSRTLEKSRRPVTGRSSLKIVQDSFTYVLTLENLNHHPNQFNDMLHRRNKVADLTIVLFMYSSTRQYPYCFEQKILRNACLDSDSIQFDDNQNSINSATFWAEQFISPVTCPAPLVMS